MRHSGKALNFPEFIGRIICAIFIMAFLTASVGCVAAGKRTHTEPMREAGASEVFTLILYGGNYSDDLEAAAFLDMEGDAYNFDIYAPEFNYKVSKGLQFEEGLKKAKEFVSGNSSFHQYRLSSIVDDKSYIIGYEVRPLYLPYTYGTDDVLDIDYTEKGNSVIVNIRLKPSIENMKFRDDFDAR